MKFESPNFIPKSQKERKSSFKENLPKLIKRTILISAISIAGYLANKTYKKFYPKDYTSSGTFNKAFKDANEDGKDFFKWNGKRYTTELVDKEFSDNYWESKKFLEDYYNSDYFKSKNIPDSYDSSDVRFQLWDEVTSDPRYVELSSKSMKEDLTNDEFNELMKYEDLIYSDNIDTTKEFKEKIDSIQNQERNERIKNLKEPTPFTITHHKGSRKEDGHFNKKSKAIFLYRNTKDKSNITTAVHELTHKSSNANKMLINKGVYSELKDRAYESIKFDNNFKRKYNQEGFDYLSDPTEIDARQNSTRFWLFKHFAGYKANTVFTLEHMLFLKNNYDKLPYDIQQLMDLFPDPDTFVSNMNTY